MLRSICYAKVATNSAAAEMTAVSPDDVHCPTAGRPPVISPQDNTVPQRMMQGHDDRVTAMATAVSSTPSYHRVHSRPAHTLHAATVSDCFEDTSSTVAEVLKKDTSRKIVIKCLSDLRNRLLTMRTPTPPEQS